LSGLAREGILGRFPVHTIPYGIDTEVYRPLDKANCRAALGLPQDKVILAFMSAHLGDARKGADLLLQMLQALPPAIKQKVVLCAIGRKAETWSEIDGVAAVQTGYLERDEEKIRCFAAADVVICTTRADNLPLVLLESLACGTPMLAFDVGGVVDLVRDGMTGFTAPANDVAGLATHLVTLIENSELRRTMAARCRLIAVQEYAAADIAKRYAELYASLPPVHAA
jgi:glycosyltransferase involved in cell wall biosynthesis